MRLVPFRCLMSFGIALLSTWSAAAQPKQGNETPEFPIGTFSDGKSYQLSEFRGKVVVLFFYESECPRCKGSIPERNEVVKSFEGKPVKFIAVGASDSLESVMNYRRATDLLMPIFADNLGLMESRYGMKISLNNIWQFRVIGTEGKIVGYDMNKATIEKALEKAAWKYDPKDYDPKLKLALDAFEWNQVEAGMKLLTPLRKNSTKTVAESANKLYGVLKKEAEGWSVEADGVAAAEPVKAYDLYAKITALFSSDTGFKDASAAKKKLATEKTVVAELNARKAFAPINQAIIAATPNQKAQLSQQLKTFLKKHSGTPTGDKAEALIKDLEKEVK